jgi:hypothetical protein
MCNDEQSTEEGRQLSCSSRASCGRSVLHALGRMKLLVDFSLIPIMEICFSRLLD